MIFERQSQSALFVLSTDCDIARQYNFWRLVMKDSGEQGRVYICIHEHLIRRERGWSEGRGDDRRCASRDGTTMLLDHVQRPPPMPRRLYCLGRSRAECFFLCVHSILLNENTWYIFSLSRQTVIHLSTSLGELAVTDIYRLLSDLIITSLAFSINLTCISTTAFTPGTSCHTRYARSEPKSTLRPYPQPGDQNFVQNLESRLSVILGFEA